MTTTEQKNKISTYEILDKKNKIEKHTISVLVDNEFGVLSRVIGLFSSRGYNLESLTVNEIDKKQSLSRITIVTKANPGVISQVIALLNRLVPVHKVEDLTVSGSHIEREVGLFKVISEENKHHEALDMADKFGARTVDSTPNSFVFELSDTSETLDSFIKLLKPLGLKEICRTGPTAMSRGKDYLCDE